MKHLRIAIYSLTCLLLAVSSLAVWRFAELAQNGMVLAQEAAVTLQEARAHISTTFAKLDAATGNLEAVTGQVRELLSSKKSRESLGLLVRSGDDINRMFKRINETLDILQAGIKATDANLNERLIPQMVATVAKTDQSLNAEGEGVLPTAALTLAQLTSATVELEDQTRKMGGGFGGLTTAAERAVEDLRKMLNDPAFKSTATDLAGAMHAARASLENTEKITARWAKPVTWVRSAFDYLIGGLKWFKP